MKLIFFVFLQLLVTLSVSEAFLNCYQCDNDWEDDDCWKEDSGNFGRKIECGPEYDACAKSYGVNGDLVVVHRYCSTIDTLKTQKECINDREKCKKWNEGGCVKHIKDDPDSPHLEQKICYCKGDNCNSAMGNQNSETNFYFKMSIIIFNVILSTLI